MKNIKEPVRLRQRPLKDGNISLYLDIYAKGVRKREFLKMYLIPERNKRDKDINSKTIEIANSIKSQMIIDIQSGKYDVKLESRKDVPFFAYYDKLREKVDYRKKNLWQAVRQMLLDYCKNENLSFKNIDKRFVQDFRDMIDNKRKMNTQKVKNETRVLKPIQEGTKHIYFSVFKAVLNQAVKDGIIDNSPASSIKSFKPSEAKRTYLTAEEVKILAQSECKNDVIKNTFLFSCLTGLRLSDVKALKWGDVSEENGYTRITFRQQKTHWQEYLDINKQAVSLMGERRRDDLSVFNLDYSYDWINKNLAEWTAKAGISKHVTFHVARHTFATMMLSNGVDLYTVSKLVGHRDISTTQIYAKVMDKDKQKAVDKMPQII